MSFVSKFKYLGSFITQANSDDENMRRQRGKGVEAFLYCQIEGAMSDETVTLARQQSTDLFVRKVNVVPH